MPMLYTKNSTQLNALHVTGIAYSDIITLTDGPTITPDMSLANNFIVTLGGDRTLANALSPTAGQSGVIILVQDGSGSHTISVGTYYHFAGGSAPSLTSTPNAIDVIAYYVRSSTSIICNLIADVKTT